MYLVRSGTLLKCRFLVKVSPIMDLGPEIFTHIGNQMWGTYTSIRGRGNVSLYD